MGEVGDLVVRLIADIREFMGKMDEAEAKVGEFAAASEKSSVRFGKAMSKMGTAVIGLSAVVVGYGIKKAFDYNKAIEAIGFQSGASAQEVDRLKTHILDLSVATATSATDLAAAYTQVEKAGFSGAKADAIISNSAKLAKLTNTDLITSTKDLIAVQALHLNGQKNSAETAGTLLKLNKMSVGSMDDLTAMFTGKPAASIASYGISMNTLATGVAVVAHHGLNASIAMTSFATGLARLEKPGGAINTLLSGDKTHKGIGMSQKQLVEDLRKPNGLFVALNDLKSHFLAAGYPAKEFAGYLTALVGPRGASGFGIMAKYLGEMKTTFPDLANGSKTLADQWAKFQKTPEFKFGQLKESFNKAMTQIGNFVLPVVIDVANALLAAQKWLADPKHKIYAHIVADVAIGIVATAIISKITGALRNWTNTGAEAKMIAQGVTEIGLLTEISANTLAMAGELVTVATEAGVIATETGVVAAEGGAGGIIGLFSKALAPLIALAPELIVAAAGLAAIGWVATNFVKVLTNPVMSAVSYVSPLTNERGGQTMTPAQYNAVDMPTPYGNITAAQAQAASNYVTKTLHDTYSADTNSKYYKDLMKQFQSFAIYDTGKKSTSYVTINVKGN
jgi:hypothetical protein